MQPLQPLHHPLLTTDSLTSLGVPPEHHQAFVSFFKRDFQGCEDPHATEVMWFLSRSNEEIKTAILNKIPAFLGSLLSPGNPSSK